MIDLNTAEPQTEAGAYDAIPAESVVMVMMTLRPSKPGKGTNHPLVSKSSKGNEYIDTEMTVLAGRYKGRRIWNMFTIGGNETARKISFRTLRAIVEGHHNIAPDDMSPTATAKRTVSDWADLNGLCFPIVVGVEWGEPKLSDGKRYLNNTLKHVLTNDDERWQTVNDTGEIISDVPLPPEPTAATTAKAAAAWNAPAVTPPLPPPIPPVQPALGTTPAWAAKR
jgi:hypothetical protein